MKFLFPSFLWALFLVIIPILIHLFNFRRYKTVYFSNVQFLHAIKKETKSRSQLRNLLLLLTRVLLIVFLVLVFARPYIPSYEGQEKQGHNMVTVYIDNSFSMESMGQTGALLERAKIKAIDLCKGFAPNTQFQLITNNLLAEHQRFVGKDQVFEWISNVNASHIVRPLHDIIDYHAETMVDYDTNNASYLFVLSDFQKSSTMFPPNFKVDKGNTRYVSIPFKAIQQSNLSVDSVWFSTPGHYVGKEEKLMVRLRNYSSNDLNQIPLELYINDTLKTKTSPTIKAQEYLDVPLSYIQRNVGPCIARLEVSDYPITFDNTLHFNYNIADKIKLLLVNQSNSYNYSEKLYEQDDNFEVKSVSENNAPYDRFAEYSLIILNGLTDISSGMVQSVSNFVEQGGTVIVFPSKDADLTSYNNLSDVLHTINWGHWIDQKGNVANLDFNHRAIRNTFKASDKNMSLPSYSGFFDLQISSQTVYGKVYTSESAKVLFAEQKIGNGTVFISALPLANEYTNLMVHPLFVPLMYNVALQSVQFGHLFESIKPQMQVTVADDFGVKENIELINNKSGDIAYPEYLQSDGVIRVFPDADYLTAGSYKVKVNEGHFSNVSFNYNRSESNIEVLDQKELGDMYAKAGIVSVESIAPEKNIAKSVDQLANGKDLSRLFLMLVLLMFSIEALLIRFSK